MMPGPHAVLVMRFEEDATAGVEQPAPRVGCRQRLCHAPWGSILFGDDPALLALTLLFALVLLALFEGLWPLLAILLLLGFVIRTWLWCRDVLPDDGLASRADDLEMNAEHKTGDAP